MKNFLLILLLLPGIFVRAQFAVNASLTANQLMQDFIGSGVTVSNIVYTGGAASRGSFSNGNATNLGLGSGIVLCTGYASAISNPASFLMSNNLGLAGDATLNSINLGTNSYDASMLEFDFVPVSDSVKFKYVFASEEYPNYICSQYNDVFAFFISGPNPAGGNYTNNNIALIPGTSIPVSVNSVNSGIPGSGFSSSGCTSLSYSGYYINNAAISGTTITFGGFTTPLTARCSVVPCQTYHMKIAVADGYNGLYDSGVFLEANSFSSNSVTVNHYYTDTISGDNSIEGCSDAVVTFTTQTPVTSPLTISFTITGTALNGTDYTNIPASVIIPAGQDSVGLIIHPLADMLTEGTETIILNVTNGCATIADTLYIIDKAALYVNAGGDQGICSGEPVTITAAATGGIPPYTYIWNSATGNGNTLTISPAITTTYVVTVYDHCSSVATDEVAVTVNHIPVIGLSAAPDVVCSGQPTVLTATGSDSYTWLPGNLQGEIVTVAPSGNTTYTVTGTNGGNCFASATISVQVITIDLTMSSTSENCGQKDGTATVVATTNGAGILTYLWNTVPVQVSATAIGLGEGDYSVTVSGNGCSSAGNVSVDSDPGPDASFIADPPVTSVAQSTINFTDDTPGIITSWFWDLGDGTSSAASAFSHNYTQAGTYQVTLLVTDESGCSGTAGRTVVVNDECTLFIPNTFTPNGDGRNDVFTPYGTHIDAERFEMIIFDRYGIKVYETKKWLGSSCEGWNGTRNNNGGIEKAVTGVYGYHIYAGNSIDGYKTYTGGVTLIQ
ncbi:MAG TPA: choice-of-anchor L domain-containing protein [Bacteroidales bacterium]|nr:choice-of-anchor L domain-containing protein [Bacteroidales bacterium]